MPCFGQLIRSLTFIPPPLSNWAYDTQREMGVKATQTQQLQQTP